jgi:hypothetical protein
MESNITTETTTTLKLTELEASWLKGLVQNPMCLNPQDESDFEQNMRQSFWNALDTVKLDNKRTNAVKQV